MHIHAAAFLASGIRSQSSCWMVEAWKWPKETKSYAKGEKNIIFLRIHESSHRPRVFCKRLHHVPFAQLQLLACTLKAGYQILMVYPSFSKSLYMSYIYLLYFFCCANPLPRHAEAMSLRQRLDCPFEEHVLVRRRQAILDTNTAPAVMAIVHHDHHDKHIQTPGKQAW